MPSSRRKPYVLVLDLGTTGVKALVFGPGLRLVTKAYQKIGTVYGPGARVEQDPEEILAASITVLRRAARRCGLRAAELRGMGITNQRETVVFWDRRSGQAIHPAIVWKDSRTRKAAARLDRLHGAAVRRKTGLPIIPYFSATKMGWVMQNVPQAKKLLRERRLSAGTIDSWVIARLTAEGGHLTDKTNACRTLLMDVRTGRWSPRLQKLFGVPAGILPKILPSRSAFGTLKKDILGFPVPVLAVCGDQQSSLAAAGKAIGTTKITYGTGTFILQVIGRRFLLKDGFFTTLGADGQFVLEAKTRKGGTGVQPLIKRPKDLRRYVEAMAKEAAAIVRNLPIKPKEIILDGGVTKFRPLRSIQKRATGIPTRRQAISDGTALGAARLASGE